MIGENYGGGSMDDMEIDERQLRLAARHSAMMGEFVMQDKSGEVLTVSPITFDHQTIGLALNCDTGSTVAEDLLYKDLDADQQRIYDELVAAGVLPDRQL